MPKVRLRIDAYIEEESAEALRERIKNLSIWGSNDDIFFNHIEIVDDSEALWGDEESIDSVRG